MPTNTSDREQRLELEQRAWALRQSGWTQRRIAAELGRDQGTICRALSRVYRRALARLDQHAARHRAVQVDQLEHVVDEALQAWERSKRPKKRSAKRTGGAGKAGGDTLTAEAIERDGDPAFLATAMQALDRIRNLLGLALPPAPSSDAQSAAVDIRTALLQAEEADAEFPADFPSEDSPPCDPSSL